MVMNEFCAVNFLQHFDQFIYVVRMNLDDQKPQFQKSGRSTIAPTVIVRSRDPTAFMTTSPSAIPMRFALSQGLCWDPVWSICLRPAAKVHVRDLFEELFVQRQAEASHRCQARAQKGAFQVQVKVAAQKQGRAEVCLIMFYKFVFLVT